METSDTPVDVEMLEPIASTSQITPPVESTPVDAAKTAEITPPEQMETDGKYYKIIHDFQLFLDIGSI